MGKSDSWGLTADKGVKEFANLISFSENPSPPICIDLKDTETFKGYLDECSQYYKFVLSQRTRNLTIVYKDTILNKANNFINKLENETG